MSTLLLDTHALAWAVGRPDRLSDRARSAVADPANHLIVSAASAWELSTKLRLGRFPEAELLVAQFPSLVAELGAEPPPITDRHALRAGRLGWDHRDPLDRMLAAQALLEPATPPTRDHAFPALGGPDTPR